MDFNYHTLWQTPSTLIVFACLALSLIFCYLTKNKFIRVGCFLLALILGVWSKQLEWIGVGLLLFFGCMYYFSIHAKHKWWRQSAFLITLTMAIALMLIKVPGIHNWQVVSKIQISPDAIPYSMRFTFDKSLIGLFFLWFSVFSVANSGGWKKTLTTACLMGLLAVGILIPLSYALGYVRFEPNFTAFFFIWALNNLLFVSLAEEALFRGMIQKSLTLRWQHRAWGSWAALLITACLFGAAHYVGGIKYMLLAGVAGLLYGYAFMRTQRIEASVLTHFIVNSLHFLFFTYPALKSAF